MILEDWSQKLRQRLSSEAIVLQSKDDVEVLTAKDGGDVWVVARSACVFHTLDVSAVPDNRLEKAVSTQIPLLSPYKQPGYWFLRQGANVAIWIWDEAARKALADQQAIDTLEFAVVPESCFANNGDNGIHVYQGVEGVFVQQWQDGKLLEDRWWPKLPDEREWRMFLRGVGRPFEVVAAACPLEYSRPGRWAGVQLGALTDRFVETFLVKGIATVFIFLFAFQLTGSVRLLSESWALEEQISVVRESHQAAILNREKAFETRLAADRLSALHTTSPVHLIERVAGALPDSASELITWRFESGQLEFVLKDPSPDLEAYVRSLEATGSLTRISVEPIPRAGQLKITSQVIGL